ncbi:MAG: SPOR domain-containing protein [Candidatus Aminicenantes bacterium]|nr:SPOR domain-containing protein [Candidatus Aminicenantes bacterium]
MIPHLSPSPGSQKFVVQVGSYLEIATANKIKRKLQKKYPAVCITLFKASRGWYHRVRVNARSQKDAQKTLHSLLRDGYKAYILEEYVLISPY